MFEFRYCSFVIRKFKQNTARAIMLQKLGIKFTYTVEASTNVWKDAERKVHHFSFENYKLMGRQILQNL
jgi:hypothetical protein